MRFTKKRTLVYVCLSMLIIGGCGKTTDKTGDMTEEVFPTQSNVMQTEQGTTDNGNVTYDFPPCVMVDDKIFKDTGYASSMIGCGNMDGEIQSTVDGTKLPTENNQSNFGTGYPYQRGDGTFIIVMLDSEKRIFKDIENQDNSIPKQVMNFDAKVEEVMENGKLLVSYISVADGFVSMSEGEYVVPLDNLQDEIQVGDVVRIWFDGNIMETYPAQIGKVYRIEKADQNLCSVDIAEQNKAYGEILWNVYYLGQIEGKEFAFPNAEGNSNGGFAVYDIDGDDSEELLLYFDGGCMAVNVEYIWGYSNGSTHVELSQFPLMTYYDNGIIEVGWSHNQGLAGDFWPYTVYQYNREQDEYQYYGGVDAWDKNSTGVEVNYEGEKFPSNIDTDGDGIVYYILPEDWDGHYNMTPLDGEDYESWRNEYLGNAKEIEDLSFQELTEENIQKLGAPKPDIQFPEPLG